MHERQADGIMLADVDLLSLKQISHHSKYIIISYNKLMKLTHNCHSSFYMHKRNKYKGIFKVYINHFPKTLDGVLAILTISELCHKDNTSACLYYCYLHDSVIINTSDHTGMIKIYTWHLISLKMFLVIF